MSSLLFKAMHQRHRVYLSIHLFNVDIDHRTQGVAYVVAKCGRTVTLTFKVSVSANFGCMISSNFIKASRSYEHLRSLRLL